MEDGGWLSWRAPATAVARLCARPSLRGAADVAVRLVRGWRDDRIGALGAEVAFFSLLSIFPGLLALAAALGSIERWLGGDVARQAQERVVGFLEMFLTERAAGTVDAVRELFGEASGGVLTLGAALALWATSRGMAAVLRALAQISDVEERRSWLRTRALALGLAAGGVLVITLMLAMLVLGPFLGIGHRLSRTVGLDELYATLWRWLGLPAVFVVLVGWAAVVLHAAPHRHLGWRHDLVGAGATGLLWLAVSLAFRLYLELFGGNQVFGVLGGALVVLLWLYVLSLALLVGGQLNAVLAERRSTPGVCETG